MLKSNTIRFVTDTFGDALNFVDEEIPPSTYTVTWIDEDGTVLRIDRDVAAGTVPAYDSTPTKGEDNINTYTFAGWTPTPVAAVADAEYTATYDSTKKHYTVTWKDEGGTILETDTNVEAGTVPRYDGVTPTKAETRTYTYTFDKWTPTPAAIEADTTYTATFSRTKRHYTITWKNYDDTVIVYEDILAGVTPSFDYTTPTRPEDTDYTYTFKKWTPSLAPIYADTVYTAVFTATEKAHPPSTFTVVWKNGDIVLETDTDVASGATPSYNGATPTKAEDAEYTYTFAGWTPTPVAVTADAEYTAVFTSTEKPKYYTVFWWNYDKSVLETDENVLEGTVPSYDGATPTKPESTTYEYQFDKWTPTPAAIEADTTYTATFSRTKRHYTITWKNYDDTVIIYEDILAGVTAKYDLTEFPAPTRPDDDNFTYTFTGWTPTPVKATADATYTATFSSAEKPQPEPDPVVSKQALLISKVPLDCTEKTTVSNFLIEGEAPTGTKRRLIFKIDDALYKFNSSGNLIAYTGEGNFDDVIVNGNQAGWLNGLSNLTGFVGKKIYPIIALQAPYNADDLPTIKVSLVTATSTSKLTDTQTSPVYELADEPQTISEITDKTTVTGQATYTITVRLRDNSVNAGEEDATDNWSSYMTLAQAAGKQADAVQFKVKSTVTTTDGTDSVTVNSVTISHSSGEAIVSGSSARLFSVVQSYELDLQTCYVVVRHEPLVDSVIEAYANFMELPKTRELIAIGTATGSRQELTLGLDSNADKNIVATSIRLYADDKPLYDFDFSTELGTVIFTATAGAAITASYEYDYGVEEWIEMTPRVPQPYNDNEGLYASRFFINLSHANTVGKKISNVMIRIRRLSGSATENLGVATGKKQLFTLKHKAKPSSITFANVVDFSYDEDSGILALVATKGTALNVAYNWQGENIVVRSFAAGWIPTAGYDYQEGDYEYTIEGGGSSDYELPTMAPTVKGGAKNGTGLVMAQDTVNVDLSTAITTSTIDYDDYWSTMWETYVEVPKEYFDMAFATYYIWLNDGREWSDDLSSWEIAVEGTNFTKTVSPDDLSSYRIELGTDGTFRIVTHAVQSDIANIIIGDGLSLTGNTLNASASASASDYELPTMAPTVKGGAKLGNSLIVTDHTLHVALGTTPLTLEGSMWLYVP